MRTFAPIALLALCLAVPAQAAESMNRAQVEKIIEEYIAAHPDKLLESLKNGQEKIQAAEMEKAKKSLKEKKKDVLNDPTLPFAGNPKGDVVVAEFFDYHCGYCKRMLPVITQLIEQDKNVKVVFHELPILSEDSETAARAATAVFHMKPEKYFAYHTALMNAQGKFDEDMLKKEAEKLGIKGDALVKEMASKETIGAVEKSRALAEALAIRGTPFLVVGDEALPGAVSLDDLKKAVKAARK